MRLLLAFLFFFLAPQSPPTMPPIGVIDFYGLRTVSEASARGVLGFHEGDTVDLYRFSKEKQESERKLAGIPGVKSALISLVCCTDDHKSILYVGIEEPASPCLQFQAAPQGTVRLTGDIVQAGKDTDAAFEKAIEKRDFGEDDSQGHALAHDRDLRAAQLRFLSLAEAHLANLRDVLHNSSDEKQRALAAQVLGYAKDKQTVVPDLVAAMRDPSFGVRNNAARALLVFAKFAPNPPAPKIQVPPQPFIEMLASCTWTDRNKSLGALAELTESRDPSLLSKLRKEALPSLVEMAQWKSMGHAWSSLMILGRIGGLSEEEIQKDLEQGNREKVIAAVRGTAKP